MDKNYTSTIAAISTALAPGGVGMVRVCGEDSINIVDKFFTSSDKTSLKNVKGYRAKLGKIYENNDVIDEVIVLIFKAPHSYTGENTVEIFCHGGVYITKKVLDLAIKNGAFLAKSGDFTKRAFLNGKIDLSQAEAVMSLVSAKGKAASRIAVGGLEGELNKKIDRIKRILLDITAELSVWTDYPEENFPHISPELLKKKLEEVIFNLRGSVSAQSALKAVTEGLKIAIVGRPNVGKSSLLNFMLGYKRAIVTDFAGTTRDVIEGQTMIGEIPVTIFDTAGIHETVDIVEKIGVDRAKDHIRDADLIFAVFDSSEILNESDRKIINLLGSCSVIAILNKSDLKTKIETSEISDNFKSIVQVSTVNGSGMKEIENAVYNIVEMDKLNVGGVFASSQRQFDIINRCILVLKEARDAVFSGVTLDAVTVLIQNGVEILAEITGENVSEEVIDKIFSNFCVGK